MNRKLTNIFVVPPISVLDIRQKYWKDRKREWLQQNIHELNGRDDNLLKSSDLLKTKTKSTSYFDPVLCEIIYKWFSKETDLVFDRFSGGSVRGVVSGMLNRNYVGVDCRDIQLDANRIKVNELKLNNNITYYNEINIPDDIKYDLFFTCPPYFNLEKYSDLENDLSNMSEDLFYETYSNILYNSLINLKDNRFAVIVIGDVRRSDGTYINLIGRTIDIMTNVCGLKFYNEMILLQEPATAAMRSFNFMNSSRKIAKCHQQVLVFIKGDINETVDRLDKFNINNNQYENNKYF